MSAITDRFLDLIIPISMNLVLPLSVSFLSKLVSMYSVSLLASIAFHWNLTVCSCLSEIVSRFVNWWSLDVRLFKCWLSCWTSSSLPRRLSNRVLLNDSRLIDWATSRSLTNCFGEQSMHLSSLSGSLFDLPFTAIVTFLSFGRLLMWDEKERTKKKQKVSC